MSAVDTVKLNEDAIIKNMVKKKLDYATLAAMSGISLNTLYKIKRGRSTTRLNAHRIAAALKVELEEIREVEEESRTTAEVPNGKNKTAACAVTAQPLFGRQKRELDGRTAAVTANVTPETKAILMEQARKRGCSLSRHLDYVLESVCKKTK